MVLAFFPFGCVIVSSPQPLLRPTFPVALYLLDEATQSVSGTFLLSRAVCQPLPQFGHDPTNCVVSSSLSWYGRRFPSPQTVLRTQQSQFRSSLVGFADLWGHPTAGLVSS